MASLAGEPSWIRSNLTVFAKKGKVFSHDWLNLVVGAGEFLFAGLFPGKPLRAEAIHDLVAAIRAMLQTTSAFDSDNRDAIDKLKLQTIVALVKCETVLPATELAVMFHVLLHVPDMMYRWNNPRNFWSFFGERCMGYYIRFIHNRDLAAENIMTAYARQRLILDAPPGVLRSLLRRLHRDNVQVALPSRSALSLVDQVLAIKGTLPGEFGCQIKRTRRNSRKLPRVPANVLEGVVALLRTLGHPANYKPVGEAACDIMTKGQGDRMCTYSYVIYYTSIRNTTGFYFYIRNIT